MAQLNFQSGEVVVRELRPTPLGVWPLYIVTLGLYEIWRRRTRFILTNQRVIISKGVVNRAVRFLPLDRVQDATLKNQLWIASILLSSAGGVSGIESVGPCERVRRGLSWRGNAHVRFGGRGRGNQLPERQPGAPSPTHQIQALDRTAPTLPMLPTTPERATHDYEHNGTCGLFAALNMATGTVKTDIRSTHTSADFVAFLNKVNRNVPDGLEVHVILD